MDKITKAAESSKCPPRARLLIDLILYKLNVDCTNLLGKNFGSSSTFTEVITFREFFAANDEDFFLIKSELEDSYEGYVYTIMQIKEAIKIGGIMLGNGEDQIREKMNNEAIDEEYNDALEEFGDLLSGMIDYVFRNKLPMSVHVKLSSCARINKDNVRRLFPDAVTYEYVHTEVLMYIKGFETGKFNIFIPVDLIEEFYGEAIHEKSTNVLVVDDSAADTKIIKKYLANTEYNVFTAGNVADTFGLLQREKIHLILLDLIMPELNGIEVCRRIKKAPYTKGIPVVFISGRPTEAAVIEALQLGARDFMVKPFSKAKLLERIDKFKVKKKVPTLY